MKSFPSLLQSEIEKLPFTKGLDDGCYNDGQIAVFEMGAKWAYELLTKNEVKIKKLKK